jgi:hypothetical protein
VSASGRLTTAVRQINVCCGNAYWRRRIPIRPSAVRGAAVEPRVRRLRREGIGRAGVFGNMAGTIALLVMSVGVIAAGWGYVKTAARMRSFQTTRGSVVARELALVGYDRLEARWGTGGGYRPKVTYTYAVGDRTYTSDRSSYAHRGFKQQVAEQKLAAIPADVVVYYNPAAPQEAYLETHTPRFGRILLTGGSIGAIVAVISLLGR